ncbi:ABC transporter substrate-binding protein [Thiocapsa sp.]|uniref:c-type cytochrome n=1 Tax=Thiocapsa sp. TaxID=2024551 RepID=UPI0025D3839A|nr:ABC transporter substrate-binding protein [Thiocapsa sp.]
MLMLRAGAGLWLALISVTGSAPGAAPSAQLEMAAPSAGADGVDDAATGELRPSSPSSTLATPPGVLAAGRLLFQQGRGEPPVEVDIGEIAMVAEQFPCVGCHGEHGRGRSEGGLVAPAIDWRSLGAPRQGFNPRPAYTRDALQRALAAGMDPAGRTLDAGMPRYRLTAGQVDALASYLEALSGSASPGVDDAVVRFALITGGEERFAAIADAVRDAALTAAEHENARGGAYGRRIELVPFRVTPNEDADALAARLTEQPLLAAVGTFTPGRSAETLAALDAAGLPSLFPVEPQITDAADQVALYAPATRQATALAERWRLDGEPAALLLSDGTPLGRAAVRAVQRVAARSTEPLPLIELLAGDRLAGTALADQLPRAVFFFADARTLTTLLEAVPMPDGLRIYGLLDQIGPVADRPPPAGVSLVLANPRATLADGLPSGEGTGVITDTARLAINATAESLRWAGRRLTRADLLRVGKETADALYRMELVLSGPGS